MFENSLFFSSDTSFLVEDQDASIVDRFLFNDRLALCFKRLLGDGVQDMFDFPSLHMVSISFKSLVNLFFLVSFVFYVFGVRFNHSDIRLVGSTTNGMRF